MKLGCKPAVVIIIHVRASEIDAVLSDVQDPW